MKEITLQEMLSTIIGELRENGRWGTAHIYQSTLNVFSAFNNYRDLHLRKLNPVVLKRFEMHLRQRDCSWNTVSTYMKVIRSAYNRAVDLRCVRYTPRLFEHVYTGTKADKKRALEASDIGTLVRGTEMDLSKRIPSSSLQKAKMLFVFMFMMRGLPFVDLAFLHKKDLQGMYCPIVEEKLVAPYGCFYPLKPYSWYTWYPIRTRTHLIYSQYYVARMVQKRLIKSINQL